MYRIWEQHMDTLGTKDKKGSYRYFCMQFCIALFLSFLVLGFFLVSRKMGYQGKFRGRKGISIIE